MNAPVIVTIIFVETGLVTVHVTLLELPPITALQPVKSEDPAGNVTAAGNVIVTLPPVSIIFLGINSNSYVVGVLLVTLELGVTFAVSSDGDGV